MLFDIGWPELMLIGVVALVVIGPKDLPRALRVAGLWVRKARSLSREFQNSVDQMIREAELDEVRDELKKATELDLEHEFHSTVDPDGSLVESIKPPELPDYFTERAAEPMSALPPPETVAPEAPIAPDTPEPGVVGFETAEPARDMVTVEPPPPETPVAVGEPLSAKP